MGADGPRLDGGATSAGTEEGNLALLYRGRYESSLGAIQSSCGFLTDRCVGVSAVDRTSMGD